MAMTIGEYENLLAIGTQYLLQPGVTFRGYHQWLEANFKQCGLLTPEGDTTALYWQLQREYAQQRGDL